MSELIKKLANEAEQYANEQNELYGADFKIEYNKKFAELIVLECADIAFDKSPTDESACDISTAVREHFGNA
jgi:hypothetical protein